jgi:general L-amino acid transport system permease protein
MHAAALATMLALPFLAPAVAAVGSDSLGELAAAFGAATPWLLASLLALAIAWFAADQLAKRTTEHQLEGGRWTRALRLLWIASLPAILVVLHGAGPGQVPIRDWGGLLLTLLLAVISLALAFPLGIVLALGRRSSLPLVRAVSVLYIELIRGVPLVTVLFMASLMVPLVLPEGVRPETMIRAIAGFALFTAAYVAEDVRGGLAALDIGQYEAAHALGLGAFATNRLIVLPQAIRVIIPSLVGHFISLFKDTSLVVIIGLRELMGIAMAVVNQPEWLGLFREVLLFIAVVYFVFSFAMSRTSRQLEAQLGVGER